VGLKPIEPMSDQLGTGALGHVVDTLQQTDQIAFNFNLSFAVAIAKGHLRIEKERGKHARVPYHDGRPARLVGRAFPGKADRNITSELLGKTYKGLTQPFGSSHFQFLLLPKGTLGSRRRWPLPARRMILAEERCGEF